MSSQRGNACLDEDIIAAFVGGELDARGVERVDVHIGACQDCLWLVTAAAVAASSGPNAPGVSTSPAHERFERRHLIAQGGMGAVYYGYDREAGNSVAIKQLKPGLAVSDPALLGRFIREAEILRRLDHPNIVKLIASVRVGSEQQLVMEYVGGGSLRQLLRSERRLPVARASAIVLELADALSRAHHLGVIHRDIKPENVLLTRAGTPKLGDFGLAMLVDAGLSTPNAMLGTIAYLSPEALSGQVVDARADLWALGVMLFEMLTGRRPFEAPVPAALVMAILHQPTPDLEALCPDTPVELLDLLYRLLTKDRNQRIASARQVGAALEALMTAPDEPLHVVATQRAREAPPSVPDAAPARFRLPAQTTPFIGRESELAELAHLLGDRDVRAVTIIGPGGMGKSRLALEAARRLAGSSLSDPHPLGTRPLGAHASQTTRTGAQFVASAFLGVFFVDLAPLGSPDLIVPAVAEAVGFQFKPGGDPKRQLLDYFREKRWLLLMDNFEHVVAGASFVNELLQTAEGVKVLATSRERLGLRAEAQFILSGMNGSEPSAESDAAGFSAVELFIDSARRTRFGFEPTPDEAAEIAAICRLVHGMPLGIVLAASWIDTLSLPEIAGEIGKNIDFLQSEASDLPSRQQSIRAVFDHSWGLLGPEEQTVLARVSIFRGGFTRAAAEAVAGASLRTLASLVAKSLLRRVPATGRYEIHELLRQYAEARLSSTPEEHEAALDRMATFYAGFASERQAGAFGPRRHQVFREIQADLVNIRRAWHWMIEHGQAERVLLSLHTLAQFYQTRRSRAEGAQVLGAVVSAFGPLASGGSRELCKAFGLALSYQALFCDQQGRKALAVELATRAVAVLRNLDRDADRAMALVTYAWICSGIAEQREVVACLEEGLAIQRAGGDRWWLVRSLVMSVRVYVGGMNDLATAEACLREAIAIQKSIANDVIVWPDTLASLGLIRSSQGHRREGCELLLEALRIAEVADDVWTVLVALQFAARAQRDLGEYQAAEQCVRRCIAHARDLGSTETVAWCHLTLGGILREQGRFGDAIGHYEEGARDGADDAALVAKAQLGLGEIALQRGEFRLAEQYLARSLALCEERGIARGVCDVLEALAYLACLTGRYDDAHARLRRAFELARGRHRPSASLGVIVGLAWWCARSGQPVRAAELASLVRHHPATAHPLLVRRIEPLLGELALALDPAALDAAVARGRRATLEGVFEAAFSDPSES